MCIRDRLHAERRRRQPDHPRQRVHDFGVGDELAVHALAIPVSYTHLRAHETVLDLVCRLLLEKKKNEQDIYTLRHCNIRATN